jgi:hypothetical protein
MHDYVTTNAALHKRIVACKSILCRLAASVGRKTLGIDFSPGAITPVSKHGCAYSSRRMTHAIEVLPNNPLTLQILISTGSNEKPEIFTRAGSLFVIPSRSEPERPWTTGSPFAGTE